MRFLTKKDFEMARDKNMNIEFLWPVFSDCEYQNSENIGSETLVIGKDLKKLYEPLEEYPDLFLKLASLGENYEDINLETVKKWIKKYGILDGINPIYDKEEQIYIIEKKRRFSSIQNFVKFREKVHFAHRFLTLYEDVLEHRDDVLKKKIKPFKTNIKTSKGIYKWEYTIMDDVMNYILVERYVPDIPTESNSEIKLNQLQRERLALGFIFYNVSCRLNEIGNGLLVNQPIIKFDEKSDKGYSITPTWSFKNLWACILMQFYWVLIDVNEKVRCKKCGRLFKREKGSRALYCHKCREEIEPRKNDYYHRMKELNLLIKEGYDVEEIKRRLPRARRSTIEKKIKGINS